MQSIQKSVSDESPHQLISARTIFSVRPTDPPSSPPPTSPLPPLPEIALYKPVRCASSVSPVPRFDRPRRPPRPSVSLSDLKPRTIQSPEIARRQRSTALAAQTRLYPVPAIQSPKECSTTPEAPSPSNYASTRLLTGTSEPKSNFSDDVLSALPKFFQRSSPTSPRGDIASRTDTPTNDEDDRIRAWQVYYGAVTKGSTRQKRARKEISKPIARPALFVPNRPFPTRRDSLQHRMISPQPFPNARNPLQNPTNSKHALFSPFHSPKRSKSDDGLARDSLYIHADGLSVDTSVPFDFGHAVSLPRYASQASVENLTSLPQLPSTTNLARTQHENQFPGQPLQRSLSIWQAREKPMSPSEAAAFVSLPSSETIEQAGLSPSMSYHPEGNYGNVISTDLQTGPLLQRTFMIQEIGASEEEESRPLTEEELKEVKRKKLLWALSTIALVLLATAGILVGIIWKLNNL